MKGKIKKTSLKLKIAILMVFVILCAIIALFTFINNSRVQSFLFSSINSVSSLKINSAQINLNLLKRSLVISNIDLQNPKKKQQFISQRVLVDFKLYPLLKGSINIKQITIEGLRVEIGQRIEKTKSAKPKIGLANLLLLRNLNIENAEIIDIIVNAPKYKLEAPQIIFSFEPNVWGTIKLAVKFTSPKYIPSTKPEITADEIVIKGSTDVNNWIDLFPYVDDLSGSFKCGSIKWKNLNFKNIDAKIFYSKKKIELNPLNFDVGGNKMSVGGHIDSSSEKYSLNINIPNPIYLPSLTKDSSFINTSGQIRGEISIEGKGLDYKSTSATAKLKANHTLSDKEPLPADLTAAIKIADGLITIDSATLKLGDYPVRVGGSFNYIQPHLNLDFEGDKIPAETVLSRFGNKHYYPAAGVAKVSGKFSGWKPNLKFSLSVDASPLSYYDMVVDSGKMELDLTYNQLNLDGRIFENGKESGTVNLKMSMGGYLSDGTREKKFTLNAKLFDHDLTDTMKKYGLGGTADATLDLSGSPTAYAGSAKGTIKNGNLKGIDFVRAESDVKFSPKKITFDNIKFDASGANPVTFHNSMYMDIEDYGIRLYGTPRPGLKVDAKYLSSSGQWQIANISYASLEKPDWESVLTGTVNKDGGLGLRVSGILDSSLLANIRELFREADGPVMLENIAVGGTTKNPSLNGNITFKDNTIQLRGWGYYLDKINGKIGFSGQSINIEELRGQIEYGDFDIKGRLSQQNFEISQADLSIKGNSIRYATPDRSFRMEFDCDLKFSGNPASSNLAGTISVVDGKYTKYFSILDKMKGAEASKELKTEDEKWKNMQLDLKVRSTGDLKIDNNIGEIWLTADLAMRGSRNKPNFIGNVETTGGEINYGGFDFDVTRGFVEFRDPYSNPYVEFEAAREIGDYNITLIVNGRIDRLMLDFSSTPPLEKRDIIAVLSSGTTGNAVEQARFGYQLGTGIATEQVGTFLQGPIKKFTPIDRFRVQKSPDGKDMTRLDFGKDVSDRLRVHFITDVGSSESIQTFEAEYAITDFLLLKGAGTTEANYKFDIIFRFKE